MRETLADGYFSIRAGIKVAAGVPWRIVGIVRRCGGFIRKGSDDAGSLSSSFCNQPNMISMSERLTYFFSVGSSKIERTNAIEATMDHNGHLALVRV